MQLYGGLACWECLWLLGCDCDTTCTKGKVGDMLDIPATKHPDSFQNRMAPQRFVHVAFFKRRNNMAGQQHPQPSYPEYYRQLQVSEHTPDSRAGRVDAFSAGKSVMLT